LLIYFHQQQKNYEIFMQYFQHKIIVSRKDGMYS